jgi:trk system potassium uptake protein TrkH
MGLLIAAMAMIDVLSARGNWQAMTGAAAATATLGMFLVLSNRGTPFTLDRRQAFLLTVLSWPTIVAFGALPFVFSTPQLGYTDAFFEAMSAMTTTGSTVLTDLDHLAPDLLLWRGLLQWIGGIGIIAMAIVLLPGLQVGGMQLFRLESSDRSEKILPRMIDIVSSIVLIYFVLAVLCALAYGLAGMTVLEASVHAMTTLSTGGFSTSDASIGHFRSGAVEWIAIVFMIAGSLPFVLYVQALYGKPGKLWRDQQVRAFVTLFLTVALLLTLWLSFQNSRPLGGLFRATLFNIVSIITTTGFVSEDYSRWGHSAVLIFFLLTFVGGCVGSTSGGIKIYRFLVAFAMIRQTLYRLIYPHGVAQVRYGEQTISDSLVASVLAFLFVYVATVCLLTLGLSLLGLDFVTSLSGAATAVGNVGPGLGPIIGPAGNFAPLSDGAKWLLAIGMALGRLEMMTVLVVLSPAFWSD